MELNIITRIIVTEENGKQVKYLVEKLLEIEAISSQDRDVIKGMAEALEG